jgi:2,5-diketo-D-gluconate reductase A
VASIADKHGATPAQVVIAWHLAIGNVVIPKSVTESRIRENFAALEVSLDSDDIEAINALDRSAKGEGRIGADPAIADFA